MASPKKTSAPPINIAPNYPGRWFTTAGVVLLVTWGAWWYVSLKQPVPTLLYGSPIGSPPGLTTIPSWSLTGLDFQHNCAGANAWLRGDNPYRTLDNDPVNTR